MPVLADFTQDIQNLSGMIHLDHQGERIYLIERNLVNINRVQSYNQREANLLLEVNVINLH